MSTEYASTVDGRRLAFCTWGPVDGFPVFSLHGTAGSRFLRLVNGEYERQGVRAITYDRPGFGESTRMPGRRVVDAAADIEVIADHLGLDTFAVVGISAGGPCALAAAARMPDRVVRCATIVGLGPSDAADLDLETGMDPQEAAGWAVARQGEEAIRSRLYPEVAAWAQSLKDADYLPEPMRSMLVQAFTEGLRTPDGQVDDTLSLLRPWGVDLTAIHCPTTIMIAREDVNVPPAHGHWLVANIPPHRCRRSTADTSDPTRSKKNNSWAG